MRVHGITGTAMLSILLAMAPAAHADPEKQGDGHQQSRPKQQQGRPQHGFRIDGLPFLVAGGYPRCQHQGYWISVVDPWPATWASDGSGADDVYATHRDNGHWLFNRSHPGVGLSIRISM